YTSDRAPPASALFPSTAPPTPTITPLSLHDALPIYYATNAALKLAGARRRPPRELAAELAEQATKLPHVERAEIAGPGFVNLFLEDAWFAETLDEILGAGESFGGGSAALPQRIQVEMVSANPTGPITVASARNGAYGDSVARLMAVGGDRVALE